MRKIQLLIGLTHCLIVVLCATSLLQVYADDSNFDQRSFSKTDSSTPSILLATNVRHETQKILEIWSVVSKYLIWSITLICVISIFILLHALFLMMTRYKASNYFDFITTMIVLDVIMLLTMLLSMFVDFIPAVKGRFACKFTSYITNLIRCFINWAWVGLFCQRFANIYFSIHRSKHSNFTFFGDSRKLLVGIVLMSAMTQLYVPLVMDEIPIHAFDGKIVATHCGTDKRILNPTMIKWIVAAESLLVYIMPFVITVFADFAVLIFTRESKWFTTVSAQDITKNDGQIQTSLKIQSEESIKAASKLRRFAIRRCLALATTQLLLNLPYHIVQLIDDFSNPQQQSEVFNVIYIYSDALFFLLYLVQFPLIAVFVRLLHSNYDDRARRRSQNRRQRPFTEDTTLSSAAPSHVYSQNNKRYSRELESLAAHRHLRVTLQDSHKL